MTLEHIIAAIGIPTILAIFGALIYIGRKLEVLDSLKKEMEKVTAQIGIIFERFVIVEERVSTLWKDEVAPAHSPRQLNDLGNKILNESGIKEIVEGKKADLLTKVKALNPTNAYDAEQAALDVVREIPKHYPEIVEALKTGAFKVGQGTETVLLVGGFHLRDLIFPDLGFSLTDLDKPKPSI